MMPGAEPQAPYVVFGYGSLIFKVCTLILQIRRTEILKSPKPPPHTISQGIPDIISLDYRPTLVI